MSEDVSGARAAAVSRRRNDVRRKYEATIAHRRQVWAGVVALVLPALLWAYFLLAETGLLRPGNGYAGTGALLTRGHALCAITLLVFLVGFVLVNALWGTRLLAPLREWDARRQHEPYLRERAQIDTAAEAILAEPVLTEGRIPAKFLTTNLLVILIRLFDSGQATFLALLTLPWVFWRAVDEGTPLSA